MENRKIKLNSFCTVIGVIVLIFGGITTVGGVIHFVEIEEWKSAFFVLLAGGISTVTQAAILFALANIASNQVILEGHQLENTDDYISRLNKLNENEKK